MSAPQIKKLLSLADLRALVDFAIEAYDAGHRPHIHSPDQLKALIDRARNARGQELEALRERYRHRP